MKEICGDGPILYKFRGSQDIRGSSALSVDQYMRYMRGLLRQVLVPSQISEILNSTPLLLLGYGYFDPDFRLIYHGLLRQALDLRQDPVYSVQLPPELESEDPYRRLEFNLWDRMKANALGDLRISTVEARCDEFIQSLTRAVQAPQQNAASSRV